ncbi:uncharacterized protein BHQ10_007766 [Talaromyces amestolkiae]|uniref:Subtelomeric hrmA-associated cluster protein AFUB-079030/YDR124W-like helical bundle domain-containing protein n=1 Tax=Talaromyces amestolkiae TaxID=1196081 RepID=A0A364L7H0_TALAM|nr:uncharacterized protein BHQ10_007766 [Talaromyces amestolkiae]RAO71754.1 hypothetical protein BHQ10_007766 [Talaromyces amestolkiae]
MTIRDSPSTRDGKKLADTCASVSNPAYRQFESLEPDIVFTGTVPTHWAMMYVDRSGNVREMSNLPTPVFDSRARNAFAYAQGLLPNGQNSLPSPHTAYRPGHRGHSSRAGRSKRRRTGFREEPLTVEVVEAFEDPEDQIPLEIGDTKKVTAFYTMAFKRLQQINCRLLAKNMIKIIEPRKQVKHPYNGGRKPGGAPGEKGDPEDTKPDWWPRDVIHKEPDHIKKEYRVKLLVHLVQNLLPMGITADCLEEAVGDTRRHLVPEDKAPEKAAILEEIIRVRRIEERYLRNEIDGTTQVYVTDHDGARRGEDESDDDSDPKVITPPQSVTSSPQMQQLEASQSPLEVTSIPQHVSPLETTSGFQMPPDLSFANPGQRTPEYISTQPEFHRNLAHTPLAGPLLTPTHNQFMDHSQFAETSPTNHLHAVGPTHAQADPSAPFTGWSPAFQQNMFSPVDYTNGAGRQIPHMSPIAIKYTELYSDWIVMFHQWQQHDPEQRPRVARTRTGCLTCGEKSAATKSTPDVDIAHDYTSHVVGHRIVLSLCQTQPDQQQQIIPEADFNEIFNYASFLWDNDSPTISFPTGSSPLDSLSTPHDQLQLSMPLAVSETIKRTASTVVPPLFMSDRWIGDNGNFVPAGSSVDVSESELSDYFARSTAPPILAPLETSSRWSRMRKMLIYMCKKSEMVKNAVMAFAALQFESPRSGSRTIHTQYYNISRDMLTRVLTEVSTDQKRLMVELRHILATVFLLTYIDLLDDDVFKAHGNLRDAFHVIQRVRIENLSLTEKCLVSWLRLLDGRAVSAGGEGLFLDEDDHNIPPDMESPPDTVEGGLENAETILEDVLTRPASSFFQKVQSFMGRISRIDPWHRSRGTVDDETEVMIIAQKISKDIKALWHQRPSLMDHAVACKLVPPLLSPSLANTLSRALMVCYANYHASFVHLHRVAYKNLPRTPDVETALCAIQEVTENLMRTPHSIQDMATTNTIEPVSELTSSSPPLPINMLWPLLMLGVESDDVHQRAWVVAAMKSMESIVSNAGITADVLEEVIRRQDEAGQRMDIRQVMHDTFTRAFAIV